MGTPERRLMDPVDEKDFRFFRLCVAWMEPICPFELYDLIVERFGPPTWVIVRNEFMRNLLRPRGCHVAGG